MNFAEILEFVYINGGYLGLFFHGLNLLLCLYFFKKLNIPLRRLCYFLIFSFLIEIISRVLAYSGITNLPLLHLYVLGEFILVSWFYQSLITKPSIFQEKFTHFLLGGVFLILLNSLFFQGLFEFNSFGKTLVQIIIIGFAVLYFYNLSDSQLIQEPISRSLRLINSAILICYSGSLFIFMCGQISFGNPELYRMFWAFNAVLSIVFQLMILVGLWKVVFPKIHLSS